MPNPAVRRSLYGDVQLGDFREMLTYPGRYLNDHYLIRHESLWHFFGIIGDLSGPSLTAMPKRRSQTVSGVLGWAG